MFPQIGVPSTRKRRRKTRAALATAVMPLRVRRYVEGEEGLGGRGGQRLHHPDRSSQAIYLFADFSVDRLESFRPCSDRHVPQVHDDQDTGNGRDLSVGIGSYGDSARPYLF